MDKPKLTLNSQIKIRVNGKKNTFSVVTYEKDKRYFLPMVFEFSQYVAYENLFEGIGEDTYEQHLDE